MVWNVGQDRPGLSGFILYFAGVYDWASSDMNAFDQFVDS